VTFDLFFKLPHEKTEKNQSMFLCSFKGLNRGLYENLAHARLSSPSCGPLCHVKTTAKGFTLHMVGQVPATSSTEGRVALSIGVAIRALGPPILQDTNSSYVSSLEYPFALHISLYPQILIGE